MQNFFIKKYEKLFNLCYFKQDARQVDIFYNLEILPKSRKLTAEQLTPLPYILNHVCVSILAHH